MRQTGSRRATHDRAPTASGGEAWREANFAVPRTAVATARGSAGTLQPSSPTAGLDVDRAPGTPHRHRAGHRPGRRGQPAARSPRWAGPPTGQPSTRPEPSSPSTLGPATSALSSPPRRWPIDRGRAAPAPVWCTPSEAGRWRRGTRPARCGCRPATGRARLWTRRSRSKRRWSSSTPPGGRWRGPRCRRSCRSSRSRGRRSASRWPTAAPRSGPQATSCASSPPVGPRPRSIRWPRPRSRAGTRWPRVEHPARSHRDRPRLAPRHSSLNAACSGRDKHHPGVLVTDRRQFLLATATPSRTVASRTTPRRASAGRHAAQVGATRLTRPCGDSNVSDDRHGWPAGGPALRYPEIPPARRRWLRADRRSRGKAQPAATSPRSARHRHQCVTPDLPGIVGRPGLHDPRARRARSGPGRTRLTRGARHGIPVFLRYAGFVPVFSRYIGPFSRLGARGTTRQVRSHSHVMLDGTVQLFRSTYMRILNDFGEPEKSVPPLFFACSILLGWL